MKDVKFGPRRRPWPPSTPMHSPVSHADSGEIKKRAKAIKQDHELGMELWSTGQHPLRMLAVLIFDKKLLTQELIEQIAEDMLAHDDKQRGHLSDWLLANQLTKSKPTKALLESWADHDRPLLRRWYWYHQARQRWTAQKPAGSAALLDVLEARLGDEEPEVQWAMNFCAGWIGIHEPEHRARVIKLGKQVGLYKDEKVAKNCTPSYLPEFVRIEVEKRGG